MNVFTIKDIENLSGIKAHTIRIWEQRYSFLKPQRTGTNIRYYSNDELKTILNITLLNKYGFKISHIDKMNPAEIQEKIMGLSNTQAQQERVVNNLIQQMINLDMYEFEEILEKQIAARGIERTIVLTIFPFLEKIGILWQTGHINPAQEHLVSNIIRQKLIVGIDNVKTSLRLNKTFLLFLPEGEYHEMGLLFVCYLLKSRGAEVVYVGANVPMKDAQTVAAIKKPDYIYTHLTSASSSFNFERFLNNLSLRMGKIKTIISGPIVFTYKRQPPPNIQFKKSLAEVLDLISSL